MSWILVPDWIRIALDDGLSGSRHRVETAHARFDLVMSQLVREEAAIGDPEASRARLAALAPLTTLAAPMEARELARRLVDAGAVPERAAPDAMHGRRRRGS